MTFDIELKVYLLLHAGKIRCESSDFVEVY